MSDATHRSGRMAEPDFAAYVGLDWADRKHCYQLAVAGSTRIETGQVHNTPEALLSWAISLRERFQGRPIAVALEQRRGPVVYQLSKFPHLVLFPVHPNSVANYRQAFFPSGNKNDPVDSALLLELVMRHRDRLRGLQPDTPETRLLQELVEHRRRLVDDRTRHSNRLTACLKTYYPQPLDWIDNIDSPMGCAFLERWPTLESAQRAHPGTLRRFFLEYNCRSAERMQKRFEAIQQAIPAVEDSAVVHAGQVAMASLVAVLKVLNEQIAIADREIQRAMAAHPEGELFAGLPGAGPAMRPRLLAAFGTDRSRFASAEEIQNYSGIAPVRSQTGNTQWVHFRHACPTFLRQTFQEFAGHSLARCEWARAYYQAHRAGGQHHFAAVRSLAFKWLRVLFACWRDRRPYDEQTYTQSLYRRNSPLAKLLSLQGPPTNARWSSVAGFHRIGTETS